MRRHRRQRNWGARVHETTHYGIDAVVLENAKLRVTVLAGKGTDIVELNYKPLDVDFAPVSPGGVRVPRTDQGDAFMDHYPGGWQEVLPNGGVPGTHAGATLRPARRDLARAVGPRDRARRPRRRHRRVRDRAAHRPAAARPSASALDRATAALRVSETLVNESDVDRRRDVGPSHRVRPAVPERAHDGRRARRARAAPASIDYLEGLDSYTIRDDRIGLRVNWDARTMPYLWVWQEHGGTSAYPWWGRLRTVGLEPFSSRPDRRPRRGRAQRHRAAPGARARRATSI